MGTTDGTGAGVSDVMPGGPGGLPGAWVAVLIGGWVSTGPLGAVPNAEVLDAGWLKHVGGWCAPGELDSASPPKFACSAVVGLPLRARVRAFLLFLANSMGSGKLLAALSLG